MKKFSSEDARNTDLAMPANNLVSLGTKVKELDEYGLFQVSFAITADFSAGVYAFTMPFAGELLDVIVEARATSGSGSVGVRNGTTNLATNLIAMATDTAVTRLGNKILAYKDFAEGALVYLKTNGATDRGLVTCVFRKS